MAWTDRIKEAAYTAPDDTRVVFAYEDVGLAFNKLTKSFEFPDVGGTYVQDLGRSGRRFVLRVFFHGPNHDVLALLFQEALAVRGIGTLEHPLYGTFNVVPGGLIQREDKLVTAANQTSFDVTFFETTEAIYPGPEDARSPLDVVRDYLAQFNETTAEEKAEQINEEQDTVERKLSLKEKVLAQVDKVRSAINDVANNIDDVQREVNAVYESITQGIDDIIGEPLTMANQLLTLAQSPAQVFASWEAKFDAYGGLIDDITDRALSIVGLDGDSVDELVNLDLSGQSAVSALAAGALTSNFTNREQVIEAADQFSQIAEDFIDWRDAQYESLGLIDAGGAAQALTTLVRSALGALIELSLQLPQQRLLTLDRARNVLELVGELYGDVDGVLDQFIQQNQLTGDEIFELPIGRVVVYYG